VHPAWLALALLLSGSAGAAPPGYTLTPDETAALDEGEIVVRREESDTGGGAVGIAQVAAPPRVVLDEVMNLEARVSENRSIRAVELYAEESRPELIGARWTLSVLGISVVFHLLYDCHRDEGYCSFWLDPTKPNDVEASEGHYLVTPRGSGTRLVYGSRTDTGRPMPGWLRRWLAGRSLHQQVGGIRKRAEAR
jgi:hypothetical protein